MTTLLLIRHAHCGPVGHSLAGRTPGVHLSAAGRIEAEELAAKLSALTISAVYSSPLERALETAAPIAARQGLEVLPALGLLEIDFGDWTGKTLEELKGVPEWESFNSYRSKTRIPGGEHPVEVLSRALTEVDRIRKAYPAAGALVALVSHGDLLRTLIVHFLGVPLDLIQRLEISPASVSVVAVDDYGPRLSLLNATAGWPPSVRSYPGG